MACVEKWSNVTKAVPYQGLFFSGYIFLIHLFMNLANFFFVVFVAPALREYFSSDSKLKIDYIELGFLLLTFNLMKTS